MDGVVKLIILICLPTLLGVQGYLFRVKSEASGKGVCLTDEQYWAIAPILALNNALKKSNENGWLASVNESINEFECIPNVFCKNWNLNNAEVKTKFSSEPFELEFMETRAWSYSPEFRSDGINDFISPAIFLNQKRWDNIMVSLSILAEEAQILLTSYPQWQGKPGLVIQLLPQQDDIQIKFCPRVEKNLSASNCVTERKFYGYIDSKNGSRWIHVKVNVEPNKGENSGVTISSININGTLPQFSKWKSKFTEDIKYVTFGSKKKPAIFKLHLNNVIVLPQEPLIFQSGLIDRSPVTMALTLATKTPLNRSIEASGSISTESWPSRSVAMNQWFTDYISISNSSPSTINIKLGPAGQTFYLAGIGLASKGHHAYYVDGDLMACQIIRADVVTSNTQNDLVPESLPDISFEEVCDKLNAPNCRGVEACSPDGCFCFSGHTRSAVDGKCTQECGEAHFGPNCVQKIKRKFQRNYDLHTGYPKLVTPLSCPPNTNKIIEFPDVYFYNFILLAFTSLLLLLQSLILVC